MFKEILSLAILAATHVATAADLPTISAVGSKFFFDNGTQYYIKGRQSVYDWEGHALTRIQALPISSQIKILSLTQNNVRSTRA